LVFLESGDDHAIDASHNRGIVIVSGRLGPGQERFEPDHLFEDGFFAANVSAAVEFGLERLARDDRLANHGNRVSLRRCRPGFSTRLCAGFAVTSNEEK